MKLIRLLTLASIVPPLAFAPAWSEETPSDGKPPAEETRAEVPELTRFHDVIHVLWHDAWPKKDHAAMRAMLPEIRKGSEAVAKAKLPGILREKEKEWREGVRQLQAAVDDYRAAVEGADSQPLLDAAERLHERFERLMRIVRPPLEQLHAFHVVLYQLYHFDMPAGDLEAIRESVGRLDEAMAALDEAQLPERLKRREREFLSRRKKLSAAVTHLVAVAETGKLKRIHKAAERMHSRYEQLAEALR